MFAIERHQAILKMIDEQGTVTISELSSLFNVSSETIRKDLIFLDKEKSLIKTHGGAVSTKKNSSLTPLKIRLNSHKSEKDELSRYAINYISEGDTIFIDAGSTAYSLAPLIAQNFSNLTVITFDLEVFNILKSNEGLELVLCGGEFLREENVFVGKTTEDTINSYHVQKAFIFPSAVSLKYGITAYGKDFYRLQIAALGIADNIFVLADSDKFEKGAYLKISDTNAEYTYISDSKLSDEIYSLYRKNNINIIRGEN